MICNHDGTAFGWPPIRRLWRAVSSMKLT